MMLARSDHCKEYGLVEKIKFFKMRAVSGFASNHNVFVIDAWSSQNSIQHKHYCLVRNYIGDVLHHLVVVSGPFTHSEYVKGLLYSVSFEASHLPKPLSTHAIFQYNHPLSKSDCCCICRCQHTMYDGGNQLKWSDWEARWFDVDHQSDTSVHGISAQYSCKLPRDLSSCVYKNA